MRFILVSAVASALVVGAGALAMADELTNLGSEMKQEMSSMASGAKDELKAEQEQMQDSFKDKKDRMKADMKAKREQIKSEMKAKRDALKAEKREMKKAAKAKKANATEDQGNDRIARAKHLLSQGLRSDSVRNADFNKASRGSLLEAVAFGQSRTFS